MIGELYAHYYSELTGFLFSLCRDRALAEDVTQEAFLRALQNAALLETLPLLKCRAWLYRTAKNLLIDHARRAAAAPPPDAETAEADDLSVLAVKELCSALPDSERALFTLRYFDGYNATELGAMFGLSPEAVRSRLASARKRLRAML